MKHTEKLSLNGQFKFIVQLYLCKSNQQSQWLLVWLTVTTLYSLTHRCGDLVQNFVGQEEGDNYGDTYQEIEPPAYIPVVHNNSHY